MLNPKSQIPNPKSAPELRPPQFGLRSLLLLIAIVGLLLTLSQWLTPVAIAAIVLLILSIVAHVAGNSIGTRLRQLGSSPPRSTGDRDQRIAKTAPSADDYAPVTRLGKRQTLGWPILIVTLLGVVLGGSGGAVGTLLGSRGPVGPLNIVVGVVAFSVLGGIASFIVFGFIQVGLGAIRQSLDGEANSPDHKVRPRFSPRDWH